MFVGHFGIAELGKSARRDLPLVWLAIAAYLPDIVRLVLPAVTTEHDMYSHAIPAVLVQALAIGALWRLRGGALGASAVLAGVCLLHWPADVFTGCKPTTFDGPWIGLGNYRHPVSDLLVEGALMVAGWVLSRRRGKWFSGWWLVPAFALQLGFLVSTYWGSQFYVGDREWIWKPDATLLPVRHSYDVWICKPKAEE